jgi:adenosylmethionine-8-amino-7-oxononanoate aminotransferase
LGHSKTEQAIRPADIRERDRRYVWHPWSPNQSDRSDLTILAAEGYRVWDVDGRQYIECASLNSTVGFGRREVVDAITSQLLRSSGTDISIASHDLVGALAERLAGELPAGYSKTLFVNSGSEAWDAAVFIAASYWRHKGEERSRFIAFQRGYHGSTLAARTLTGLPRVSYPLSNPFPVSHVELPFAPAEMRSDDAKDRLIREFDRLISDPSLLPPAAVIVEPLLNVGGGIVLPDGFLAALSALCQERGTLLAVDEVFTAYGRCSAMFVVNEAGAEPDILVSSKGLASGYMPIAAVTVKDAIQESFALDPHIGGLRFGHTTSGHAPACAAALATLDILRAERLSERAKSAGEKIRAGLGVLAEDPDVVDIRGKGLVNVVEMNTFQRTGKVLRRARDLGLLLRQPGEAFLICPPLIVDEAGIDAIVELTIKAVRTSR